MGHVNPAPADRDSRTLQLDFDACYRAASGRDARWDGRVYLGVTSTGIYCRPSCPARKPLPENCRFFPSAAACVAAGFRACKRCRPDAVPGTRDWDARGDLVARAVRRIREGAIDTVGVTGLARELAVSERHLRRVLVDEIGAGPLQLARTRRAHAARALIDQTDLSLTDIAFAAGFGSVRQFGDVMREEFGIAPSQLSRRALRSATSPGAEPMSDERPTLALQLRTRAPFEPGALHASLVAHAIPGRDRIDPDGSTEHALDVPGGTAVAHVHWPLVANGVESPAVEPGRAGTVAIPVTLTLPRLVDVMPAIAIVRRMLDLDADPGQIAEAFAAEPRLAPLVAARPGLRLPAARSPHETALGTVLGQQISLAAARTVQGRLAARFATPLTGTAAAPGFHGALDIAAIAAESAESLRSTLGLTNRRAETLRALATAIVGGLDLGAGADREAARRELAALPGIGPWTVEIISMRALGDPDAYPAGDLILRRALGDPTPREAERIAEPWRPYRGYATQHLWADFLETTARKDLA